MERQRISRKEESSTKKNKTKKRAKQNAEPSRSKLRVSQPGDPHEKQADDMADKVVNKSDMRTRVTASYISHNDRERWAMSKGLSGVPLRPTEEESRQIRADLDKMDGLSTMPEQASMMSEEVATMSEEVSPMSEEVSMRRAENAEDELHSSYSGEDETIEDEMHGSLDTKSEPGVYTMSEEVSPMSEEVSMRRAENAEDELHSSYSGEDETIEDEMHGSLDTMQEEVARKSKGGDNRSAPKGVAGQLKSTKGGGSALPEGVMDEMEQGFGADLSGVRIHTDKKAEDMNKQLNSQAFAHKNDIYFNSNKFDPNSEDGKKLLAHEITHTLQQEGVQRKVEEIQKKDEPSPLKNRDQQEAFNRGIKNIHNSVQNNAIPLAGVYNKDKYSKNSGEYSELEMVTILLDVYNNQTNKPYFDVDHKNLLKDIVGDEATTAHDFLGVDLPSAEEIVKIFHKDQKKITGKEAITPTLGYQTEEQMNEWAGVHEGNWFKNPAFIKNLAFNSEEVVYENSATWDETTQEGEKMVQNADFYENGTKELELEGFNAFYKNNGYIVGLDTKTKEYPYEDGQQLGEIKNSDIEDGAHIGYTFKKGEAEFIFWVVNNGEAFLEGTIEKDGVRKRISVSSNGGMGLWHIIKTEE